MCYFEWIILFFLCPLLCSLWFCGYRRGSFHFDWFTLEIYIGWNGLSRFLSTLNVADNVSCEKFQAHTNTHMHTLPAWRLISKRFIWGGTPKMMVLIMPLTFYSTITAKLKVFSHSFFLQFIKVHSMTQFLRFLYSLRVCVYLWVWSYVCYFCNNVGFSAIES